MCIRPKPHKKSLYLSSLIFVFSFTCVFWGSCTTTTFFWKCWSITNKYLFSQLQLIHYSLHWSGYRTNVQKYMCNLYEFCEENEGYLKQSLGNRQLVGKVEDFAMEWGRGLRTIVEVRWVEVESRLLEPRGVAGQLLSLLLEPLNMVGVREEVG